MERVAQVTGQTVFMRRVLAAIMANDFQTRIRRTISHRRMMKTGDGLLGLAPALACVGDRVVLMKGLRTPVVVRPRGDGWELVGDCYIHGMMQGELFRGGECRLVWLV